MCCRYPLPPYRKGLGECRFGNYYALIQTNITNSPSYWQQKYSKAALNFSSRTPSFCWGKWADGPHLPKSIYSSPVTAEKREQNCLSFCRTQNIPKSRAKRTNGATLLSALPSRYKLWGTEFLTLCPRMVVSQAGTHHGLAAWRLSCLFTFRAVLWSLCNHWFVIQRIFGRALASAKIHDMIVGLANKSLDSGVLFWIRCSK